MSDFTPGFHIVEIFGHRTHGGYCTEISVFGGTMLRIETPALPEIPEARREVVNNDRFDDDTYGNGAWVRRPIPSIPIQVYLYGGAAIFSITPCTEEDAIAEECKKHQQSYERWVPDAAEMVALPVPVDPFDGPVMINSVEEDYDGR